MVATTLAVGITAVFSTDYGQILVTKAYLHREMAKVRVQVKQQQEVMDRVLAEWTRLNAQIERAKQYYRQRGQIVP